MEHFYDSQICASLKSHTCVSGLGSLGGFAYHLNLSIPYVVTAIHAGHRVSDALLPLMLISEKDRLAEEDVATDIIISDCPSILWGLDSRAEYDLNRPEEKALPLTPDRFWGAQVYKSSPSEALKRQCLEKYEDFYRFFGSVIQILLHRFGLCVVYDIHSYNLLRQTGMGHPSPPVFNLGTRGIDRSRWKAPVEKWLEHLGKIKVDGLDITVAENDVFGGEGELCQKLSRWDPRILVLPTEISKIYMEEETGTLHDTLIDSLRRELAVAVTDHAAVFQKSFCR